MQPHLQPRVERLNVAACCKLPYHSGSEGESRLVLYIDRPVHPSVAANVRDHHHYHRLWMISSSCVGAYDVAHFPDSVEGHDQILLLLDHCGAEKTFGEAETETRQRKSSYLSTSTVRHLVHDFYETVWSCAVFLELLFEFEETDPHAVLLVH